MDESTNPFADPAVVRVQAQQSAQASEPKFTFGYNDAEPDQPKPTSAPRDQYSSAPLPPQYQQPTVGANPQRQNQPGQQSAKNFPPIPPSWTWCPIKPIFYFNIEQEIPTELHPLVKYQYYFILGYLAVTMLNMVAGIIYLMLGYPSKVMQLLMALLLNPILAVAIFMGQYYLLYKACKTDNPNYYFWYLANTAITVIILIVQIIGPAGSGYCGFVTVAYSFDNVDGYVFMGLLGLIISVVLLAFLGKVIHTAYQCRMLYMLSKHRQLSNAISAHQAGGGLTFSVPVRVA